MKNKKESDSKAVNQFKGSHNKATLLSGIQPTGHLTIGNYIGAIKNWITLQNTYNCFFVLVDLHSITVRQDPAKLLQRCYEFIALYIACGLDSEKNTIFVQSHVPGHTQLMWILNCFAYLGELSRMTQFKDKAKHDQRSINIGLYNYPVLMAADILLYDTDLVPVGDDQKQHLEFTQNIARRFNRLYGKIFKIPKSYMTQIGARVMGLQNPTAKMSKSDRNPKNYIGLLDSPDMIRKKIKQAVTDSEKEIRYDEQKPAISNLMTIYAAMTDMSLEWINERYVGKGYGQFKEDLSEILIAFLSPIQKQYQSIYADITALRSILKKGADAAEIRSQYTLKKVFQAIGFIPR